MDLKLEKLLVLNYLWNKFSKTVAISHLAALFPPRANAPLYREALKQMDFLLALNADKRRREPLVGNTLPWDYRLVLSFLSIT